MVATPAWPPASTPRLYVADQPLMPDGTVTLDGNPAHYLAQVMRRKVGDPVLLFDGHSGEWLATISAIAKRTLTLTIAHQTRPLEPVPDIWLCVAPIKRARMEWLVEKATELGAARIVPVQTQRTIIDAIKPERLTAQMVEAAEQCGRTALPTLAPMVKLPALLATWPDTRTLVFADEGGGTPLVVAQAQHSGPVALLIGPEGGFTDDERTAIRAVPQAVAVTLGPRILRAETAAIAALAGWTLAAAGRYG